jgi:5-methyltetrahydrofolate--homocysteine methyltransferase
MVAMTFGDDFVTFTGTDPITAATVLSSLGADAIGVNCSTGPEPMLEIVGRLVIATDIPVFVEPNAGVPRLSGNNTAEYITSPEVMADFAEKYAVLGANILGTCCGSTPEHTALLAKRLKNRRPLKRSVPSALRISSRYLTLAIGANLPFCIIGERINPTNRQNLADEIQSQKLTLLQDEAKAQETEGSHAIDVNIGVPGINEPQIMPTVVRGIETVTQQPLSIDSVNPEALESALRESAGKVLINSVTGETKSLSKVPALAAQYGAGLLCLAIGDEGIPNTAEQRLQVLKKIVASVEKQGVRRDDLICDCLTLTVSAQQKRAEETLKAIKMVKEELGLPTILGISNISYGLPDRSLINSTFLSMAMSAGLDAAIMNSGDPHIMETVRAASVLTLRDKDSRNYVHSFIKKRKKKTKKPAETDTFDRETRNIFQAVLSGNKYDIKPLVERAIIHGKTVAEINKKMLIPAIEEVGRRYERKELFLPQMILAAETFQEAFKVLEPHFASADIKSKGTVIICTVKGDVHDIGKNIVALMLRNHGFNVVDLGKDVSAEEIFEKSVELNADIVGLSALMTTTMAEMPLVIELFRKKDSKSKIIVGGAVVSKRWAQEIGADSYAKDGISAVEQIKTLVSK